MRKIFGIMKDHATTEEFITNLVSCLGIGGITSTVTIAQSQLSAAAASIAGSEQALNYLGSSDITTVSARARQIILDDEMRVPFNSPMTADSQTPNQVIKIGENLALIVNERYIDEDENETTQRANIIIRKYRSEGGIRIQKDCALIPDNSNWVADCLAYCIYATEEGEGVNDVLLKVASCTSDATNLERAFDGLHIGCYKPWDGTLISEVGHTPIYFGAGGAVGGCLFAEMKESKQYGLVMFDKYHAPLFIWSSTGKFPTEAVEGQTVEYTNNSAQSLNRLLGRVEDYNSMGLPTPDFPEYKKEVIGMTVLAPIFCPSVGSDTALHSKWLYQGIHDYSNFDASGHISIGADPSALKQIFFCDYGVCIEDPGNYISSGLTVPTIENASLQMYRRPNPPMMPYSEHMIDYFDSFDGLSATGWMNVKDESNDMIFVGSPTIAQDGAVRMRQSASPAYGYCNAQWTKPDSLLSNVDGTIIFLVMRVNRRTMTLGDGGVFEFPLFSLTGNNWPNTQNDWPAINLAYVNGKDNSYGDVTTPQIFGRQTHSDGTRSPNLGSWIDGGTVALAIYPTWNTGTISMSYKFGGSIQTVNFGTYDDRMHMDWVGNMALGALKGASASTTAPNANSWKWANSWPSIDVWASQPADGGAINTDFFFYARGLLGTGDGCLGYRTYEGDKINACLNWLAERFNV